MTEYLQTRWPIQSLAIAATLVLIGMAGCEKPQAGNDVPPFVLQTLQGQGTYELLSLDPSRRPAASQPADTFHGVRVLGRTTITDKQIRQELNDALRRGAQENPNMAAGCFNPRHGIHAVSGGQTVDLVICFECLSVLAYNGDDQHMQFLISDSPKPVFDQVLTAANVPLPVEDK